MYIPAASRLYMLIPVDGPPGADLTAYTAEVALTADDGTEPGEADWHPANWIGGEAALLVGPGGGTTYPPGNYMAWVRITAGLERPALSSGRVRIGDSRP